MKTERPAFWDAVETVARNVAPLAAETIDLRDAVGRVTAEPLQARRFHPSADMSAMDGYIVADADCGGEGMRTLAIGAPIYAGDAASTLEQGTARPIMTGAVVPVGGAAVLIRERADIGDDGLRLAETLPVGMNIRRKGEDAAAGDAILGVGRAISAPMLGALIAFGIETLAVRVRPRVVVIPTGDELCGGGMVDVNGPMIAALLREAGAEATLVAPVADDRAAIAQAMGEAVRAADFVITSGGASAGDRDHIPGAVADIGAVSHFHGVRMRPGKPVLFASASNGVPILCLPGNPVAALVGCRFFGMAALRRLMGMPPETGRSVVADTAPDNGATNVFRVSVAGGAGPLRPLPGDRPHMMRSLLIADHWMVQQGGETGASIFPLCDTPGRR